MPLLPPVMTATFPSSFFGMPRPPLLCDEVSNPGEERRPTASLLRRGKGQERIREFLPGGATQGAAARRQKFHRVRGLTAPTLIHKPARGPSKHLERPGDVEDLDVRVYDHRNASRRRR